MSNTNSSSSDAGLVAPTSMDQVWSEINLPEINPSPSSGGAAPRPRPVTVLTLNTIPDLFSGPSAAGFPSLSSSSLPNINNNGDRRYKRMMKNRESASRSRARKQAYVSGLQMKIANLVEENQKLKDQLSNLAKVRDEAAHQHPRKHLLPRTKTAPF